MPSIPVYQRKISIPGEAAAVPTDIGSAGIVGKSVAELGGSVVQATGEVAKILAARYETLRKQREDAELISVNTEISDKMIAFRTDELKRKGADTFDNLKRLDIHVQDLQKNYGARYKDNPEMRNKVFASISARREHEANVLASHQLTELKAYSADVRALALESAIKEGMAGDPATGITNWSKTIDTQVANGTLSLEDGKIEKLKGTSKIQVGYISALAEKNPSMAQAAFEAAKTTLTSDDQRKLAPVIDAAIKEQRATTGYAILYKEHNGNFDAMAKDLENPETLERLGITVENSGYLKGFIERSKNEEEARKKELYDKTAKDVFLNFKTMTPGKINNLVREGKLSYQLGEHFKAELKQGQDFVTNPATYGDILGEIYSGIENPQEIRNRIYRSGELSRGDKEQLLLKTESKLDSEDARNLKIGEDYLKQVIMPSQTMITAAKPDEARNYMIAVNALDKFVTDARKSGKPANSKAVTEKARELGEMYRMTTQEQINAMNQRIAADAKKLKPGMVTPPKKLLKYNPKTGKLE